MFPDNSIISKQHYLIQLAFIIEKFEALCNVWSMRFETKHNFVKGRLTGFPSFKNIEKSIAESCAKYEYFKFV